MKSFCSHLLMMSSVVFLGHFGVTKLHSAFLLDEVQKSLMQCQQIVEYPSLYFQSNDVFLYLH